MFTAEELTRIRSEWKSRDFTPMSEVTDEIGMEILKCPAFLSLVTSSMSIILKEGELGIMSSSLALIEIGIAIGRAQATKDLIKINGEK